MFENHHNAKQHNVNQKASNKQKKKKHIQLHMWYNLTGYQAVYNLH